MPAQEEEKSERSLLPLATLKNWEQGRRYPDAPAAAYLLAIQRRPREVMEAVAD